MVCGVHYEDGGEWTDPVFRYADSFSTHPLTDKEKTKALMDELERAYGYNSLNIWLEIATRAFLRYLERTPPGKRTTNPHKS